ncbi:MAG: response regulator [candidate division WOR-3 bacterium]
MNKILIVDDIEDYLRSLENALKGDFEIIKAMSLSEAKERMNKEIKVALVDIRLKEDDPQNRDGLVFLEWVKMNYPETKVIIMSAYREFDLAVEALNLGAEYFLRKPINLVELKGTIKTVLEDRG